MGCICTQRTHPSIHTYIHAHIYISTCTYTYVYIHINKHIHLYTYTYIHTYTHIYTYIHAYLYILRRNKQMNEINPLDARSRYPDFAQTSLLRQNAVYRRHGMLPHAPEVGIPAARCITACHRKTVYSICFLMHTGPSIQES